MMTYLFQFRSSTVECRAIIAANKIPILSGLKYPPRRRLPILAKLFTVACFTNVSFSSQATAVSTDMITEHPRDIFNSHR